jgi:HSP20 family protein
MAIIRRNNRNSDGFGLTTLSPMFQMLDEMTRFPSILSDNWGLGSFASNTLASDMWEEDDAIFLRTALPGIDPKSVDITIDGDTVTIKAEVKEETEDKDKKRNFYQKQIREGSILESFTLPAKVQSDKAEANFDNGMLTVKLPKSEEAKPKRIKVNAKSSE